MSMIFNASARFFPRMAACASCLISGVAFLPQTSEATENIDVYFATPLILDNSSTSGTLLRTDEERIAPPEIIPRIDCGNRSYQIRDARLSVDPSIPHATEVTGLGMRVYWKTGPSSPKLPLPVTGRFNVLSDGRCTLPPGYLVVEWVKTGAFSSIPPFARAVPARIVSSNAPQVGQALWTLVVRSPVNPSTPPTCRPATASMTVPMGTASIRNFTGPGTTASPQPFELVLVCGGGDAGRQIAVNVTLADAVNSTNHNDWLTLTSGSTARGIGVQVLKDGRPLFFGANAPGNPWSAGRVDGGSTTGLILRIPLTARYVQTAATVTAGGSANAQAVATFNYQ